MRKEFLRKMPFNIRISVRFDPPTTTAALAAAPVVATMAVAPLHRYNNRHTPSEIMISVFKRALEVD